MRYLWQHINTIINTYNGSVPLAHFLKNYCRQHPKLGSRDRRMLSAIVYSWYRCSRGIMSVGTHDIATDFEYKVKECLALCGASLADYDKLFANTPPAPHPFSFDVAGLLQNDVQLSAGIDKGAWLQSMLVQPKLFIRIRKGKDKILALLTEKDIPYTIISPTCIALPNGAPIDKLLPPDCYVVQDASSQQTGDYFQPVSGEYWYDCCSGAGGKSLLLLDAGAQIRLTVTDKRESIISNLKDRFRLYGHKLPTAHAIDVAEKAQIDAMTKGTLFDNIICDAPCTGSGTWARTPEELYFFDTDRIKEYADRQKAIAVNVSRTLKKDGRLIYITCSVFRQENEEVVDAIINNTTLRLVSGGLINGISMGADSMYVAVLQ